MEPVLREAPPPGSEESELRLEHERLSARVAARTSIDEVRKGAYASFALFISVGLSLKFAWDRWGWGPRPARPPGRFPLLFTASALLAVALAWFVTRSFLRARVAMKTEDRDFARLREVRERLGIEP